MTRFLHKKRRASVSPFFIGFPIVVMIISIALAGQTTNPLAGGVSNNPICNANNSTNPAQCTGVNNANLIITRVCSVGINPFADPCTITTPNDPTGVCPTNPPTPSYCGPTIPIIHPVASWLLPQGDSVTIYLNQTSTPINTKGGVFFNFGQVSNGGFIAFIGIIIGIVCLAGITVLGTGAGTESIHILFLGGLMMGIWILLSGLDGFASNNPNSVFFQLNTLSAGIGTGFYIMLTLSYLFGFMGMVKRGV